MRLLAFVLSTGLLSCTGESDSSTPAQQDGPAPLEIGQRFSSAEDAGDADAIRSLLADSVLFVLPDLPPIVGLDAVDSFHRFLFELYEVETSYQSDGLEVSGDSAWDHGTATQTLVSRDGGGPRSETYAYQWLFTLSEGTGWRLAWAEYGDPSPLEDHLPRLPEPTGTHALGAMDLYFVDEERLEIFTQDAADRREVGVQIWYPADRTDDGEYRKLQSAEVATAAAEFLSWPLFFNSYMPLVDTHSVAGAPPRTADAPFPVVLYHHGYAGFTSVHTALFEDLASHGYVVVSIGHAYETALFVMPDGSARRFDPRNSAYLARGEETIGIEQEAAKDSIVLARDTETQAHWYRELLELSPLHQESVRIWAADNAFVLDRLERMSAPGGVLEGLLDLDRVGIVGHSLGGATAGQVVATDPRVSAGINLDGFQFGDLLSRPLSRPFMFMASHSPWAGDEATANAVFFELSRGPAYLAVVRGFQHSSFSDMPIFQGVWGDEAPAVAGEHAIAIHRAYVRSFFDRHLRKLPAPLLDGPSEEYPEVILRTRNTGS